MARAFYRMHRGPPSENAMLDALRQDIRYAVRALQRSPGFTLTAVLSLAFGIGVNTAVFSVVSALLFRPLPWRDAARLVDVYEHHPTEVCPGCGIGTSWPAFLALRDDAQTLDGVAAARSGDVALALPGGSERWRGAEVSASLFPLLAVAPLHGRAFDAREDAPGGEPVLVLGERLWRARFGAEPDVVGGTLRVNGRLHTIVGVMPEAFAYPAFAELWLPIAPAVGNPTRADRDLEVVARLAAGATRERAELELGQHAAHVARDQPATNAGWTMHVAPLRADLTDDYATSFMVMLGIVGFVLLVACANVANLMIARVSGRAQELAVRASLGGTRAMLARHVLTEGLVLGAVAGVLGLLIAAWALDAFTAVTGNALPRWVRYDIDVRVLLFTSASALAVGLLAALAPAIQVTRRDLNRLLTEGGRNSSDGPRRARVRNALVVVQLAAAMTLVAGAVFLTREFLRVAAFQPGHEVEGLYGGRLLTTGDAYRDERSIATLADALTERLGAATSSRDVALSSMFIPNWPGTPPAEVRAQDRNPAEIAGAIHRVHNVTPGYFRTLGIRVTAGRDFQPGDRAGAAPVAIIGRKLADQLWPGLDPLGRRLHLGGADDEWVTVIGVVPSTRGSPFARDTAQLLFLPLAQHARTQPQSGELALHLRPAPGIDDLPRRVRAAAAEIDPALVVEEVRSARAAQADALAPVRTTALATTALGLFAALLAAMGIFGLVAFTVSQRIPEFGVRMALGASAPRIARMVLRQAVLLAAVGVAFGAMGAIAVGAVLRSQFVGMRPVGSLGVAALATTFVAVAVLASWLPARRAARIDPVAALRRDA